MSVPQPMCAHQGRACIAGCHGSRHMTTYALCRLPWCCCVSWPSRHSCRHALFLDPCACCCLYVQPSTWQDLLMGGTAGAAAAAATTPLVGARLRRRTRINAVTRPSKSTSTVHTATRTVPAACRVLTLLSLLPLFSAALDSHRTWSRRE